MMVVMMVMCKTIQVMTMIYGNDDDYVHNVHHHVGVHDDGDDNDDDDNDDDDGDDDPNIIDVISRNKPEESIETFEVRKFNKRKSKCESSNKLSINEYEELNGIDDNEVLNTSTGAEEGRSEGRKEVTVPITS
jgi:hypothetical protein